MKREALLATVALMWLVGCGGDKGRQIPDTVDVSGVVTMDGKPLAGASVNFFHEDYPDFAGYGKTDDQGRFTLVQGAVPGTNKVTVSKIVGEELGVGEGDDAEGALDDGQIAASTGADIGAAPKKAGLGQQVPPEYSDASKTKLTFMVPDGGTESADFKLTSN